MFSLSNLQLLTGDYKHGLENYEFRFSTKTSHTEPLIIPPTLPKWDGIELGDGQKLLLIGEQGLGDTIQFMRYVKILRQQGINVSLCAQTKLHDLIKASEQLYENTESECANYLPCKRSIYQDLLEKEPMSDDRKSKLTIRYSSPYIQVIKDSWSYDMQNFIGEVGGTLGLLLGLSFASVFDLLEHLLF